MLRILLQEIFVVEDCVKVGFSGWTGTFTTGTDTYNYIQITGTGVSPNVTLPSAFKVNYKFKPVGTDQINSSNSGLWNIGANTNNGVLIGHEATDKRLRIYSRSNGTNTVQRTENSVYTHNQWNDAELTYNNGSISITVGGKTISYTLSTATIMQFYNSYSNLRIAEWKLKAL